MFSACRHCLLLSFLQSYVENSTVPILQMRKLRLRDADLPGVTQLTSGSEIFKIPLNVKLAPLTNRKKMYKIKFTLIHHIWQIRTKKCIN